MNPILLETYSMNYGKPLELCETHIYPYSTHILVVVLSDDIFPYSRIIGLNHIFFNYNHLDINAKY